MREDLKPWTTPGGIGGALLALAALAWIVWCAVEHLVDNSGDVAIYWVYAKSMWTEGFFHYGPGGVRHGATSPLWAFMIGLVHPVAGERFLVYKLIALALMFVAAIGVGRLARALGLPLAAAVGAALLLAGSSYLQKYAACGFETPLFMALLLFAALSTLRVTERMARSAIEATGLGRWALLLSVLPLARPEGAAFAAIFALWAIVASRGRLLVSGRGWMWLGVIVLPALLFYGWMYTETGTAIPSSVAGRYARRALQDTYQQPVSARTIVNQCTGAGYLGYHSTPFVLAWNALVAVGLVSQFRRRRAATVALAAVPALLCAFLLWKNPGHYYSRYGLSALPFAMLFAATGLVDALRHVAEQAKASGLPRSEWVARFVVSGLVVAFLWLPVKRLHEHTDQSRKVTLDNLIDRKGSKSLNIALPDSARILVYEIQTQYAVKATMFSADGIVGGEILPYLYEKDVVGFIQDYDITHVLVSEAFDYRSTFHGTVLQELWRQEQFARDKDSVVLERDGLRFTRGIHRSKPSKMPHWEAVYAVTPESDVYSDR